MEFVVAVLVEEIGLERDAAMKAMLAAPTSAEADVATRPASQAREIVAAIMARARTERFPLLVTARRLR